MWRQCGKCSKKGADDYVIATNKAYSIRYFVNQCCNYLKIKLKWSGKGIFEKGIDLNTNKIIIKINPKYFRPAEVSYLKGNYSKAKRELKWQPKTNISKLIKIMIDEELKRL